MATRGSASEENYFKMISLGYHATQWVSTRYNGKKAKWTFRCSQHCALCQAEIPLDKVPSGVWIHWTFSAGVVHSLRAMRALLQAPRKHYADGACPFPT
jgi:hypothetical protein